MITKLFSHCKFIHHKSFRKGFSDVSFEWLLKLLVFIIVFTIKCSSCNAQHADSIRLNDIRILASHNSYKKKPDPKVLRFLTRFKKRLGEDLDPIQLDYGHEKLTIQLDSFNIRGFEFDLAYDPNGGAYAKRRINYFIPGLKQKSKDSRLYQPGIKLLHIADIDYETNYLTFKEALIELRNWSTDNPNHIPLFVNLEIKRASPGDYSKFLNRIGFKKAPLTDTNIFEVIENEIFSIFSEDSIIFKPQDLKENFESIQQRLDNSGWPKLNDCLGKIIFIIDGDIEGYYADLMNKNDSCLMFIYTEPHNESCAFIIRNEPIGNEKEINDLSDKYIVRTRTDAGTIEARNMDYTKYNAAFESQAQIVSTDYYRADKTISDFKIDLEDNYFSPNKAFMLRKK